MGRYNLRGLLIIIPYIWLLVFFLLPFGFVLKTSLSDIVIARPPYMPTFDLLAGWDAFWVSFRLLDLENYYWILGDALYVKAYVSSVRIAAISTILCLVFGYCIALAITRTGPAMRRLLLMMIVLPFWTSFLIRIYAWIGIIKNDGFLNSFLLWAGIVDSPLIILNTDIAVYIGIVYSYVPLMIFALYASLERIDNRLIEAALDLGCSRFSAFWQITFPLSLPGVIAGCLLVFIPALGEFAIPDILGGADTLMIGRTLWVEFFNNRDWPVASAVAVIMLFILIVPIVLFQKHEEKNMEAGR